MDLRVYHPHLISTDMGVNCNRVRFDEHGISEPLSPEDFETFGRIPGYMPLQTYLRQLAAEELDTFLAAAAPAAPEAVPEEGEPEEEEAAAEVDADSSLFDRFVASGESLAFYGDLPLSPRLDLASDPRLSEATATQLFEWEQNNKKSKRCLTALDRRLVLLRKSKSALGVTNALIQHNFPRQEER